MIISDEPQTLEASRYRCLAEAVIIQAIKDATHGIKNHKPKQNGESEYQYWTRTSADAAVHFLLVDPDIFPFWCEVAGLRADEVRRRLIRRLKYRRTYDLIRSLHRTRQTLPAEVER